MKQVSAGIIIQNELGNLLVGRATGSNPVFWDLPKGGIDEGETPLAAAIRECKEEFGLVVPEHRLIPLGKVPYSRYKDLVLFHWNVMRADINLGELHCTSTFQHRITGRMLPEIDAYCWITPEQIPSFCCKAMSRTLHYILDLS